MRSCWSGPLSPLLWARHSRVLSLSLCCASPPPPMGKKTVAADMISLTTAPVLKTEKQVAPTRHCHLKGFGRRTLRPAICRSQILSSDSEVRDSGPTGKPSATLVETSADATSLVAAAPPRLHLSNERQAAGYRSHNDRYFPFPSWKRKGPTSQTHRSCRSIKRL